MSNQTGPPIRTATPSSVRDVNRSILLNLIRRLQPVSRAALSRHTGISRGNVSRIVTEMLADGLLTESRGRASGPGRTPVYLKLKDSAYRVLGVFIQPLRTHLAFAGLSGRILRTWSLPTPATPRDLVEELGRQTGGIRKEMHLSDRAAIRGIGIAFPGLVHFGAGQILWSPALPAYAGFSLAEEVREKTGIVTVVDNDCNLGALSELWRAERGGSDRPGDLVFLSIGDVGVGGGIIIGGDLYRGHDTGGVAEFGHLRIDPEGPRCNCGRRGCWELYISNAATWRRYRPETPFRSGQFERLLQAARTGDARAVAALQETARYLALGISGIEFVLNPSAIVLAGQITAAWEWIEKAMCRPEGSSPFRTAVRPARLQAEESLLDGAVCLALSDAFTQPRFGPASPATPKAAVQLS